MKLKPASTDEDLGFSEIATLFGMERLREQLFSSEHFTNAYKEVPLGVFMKTKIYPKGSGS